MLKLSVVIPAFNEVATLAEVVRRVRLTACAYEIIVVDDGSTDGSKQMLEEAAVDSDTPLRFFSHGNNRGKGAAVRSGLALATGDVLLVQDADLEYNPDEFPVLLAPFSDPAVQAVYGSRNLRENPRSTNTFYWGGRFLSLFTNLLYGCRLTDEATGYKAVRTELMRRLELKADGFEFCPELTGKLLRTGIEIREVPISYRPRTRAEGKKIRGIDGWHAVIMLVRCRFMRRM